MTTSFYAVTFALAVAFACGLLLGGAIGMTLTGRRNGAPTNEEG